MKISLKQLLILLVLLVGAFTYLRSSSWDVGEQDFARQVLQAEQPALVYFDTAIGCRGGDSVFKALRSKWKGRLAIFHVDTVAHPQLARTYGVDKEVVFALFEQGRVLKRVTAPAILKQVMAKNNGFYSDEIFLAELETFANLR